MAEKKGLALLIGMSKPKSGLDDEPEEEEADLGAEEVAGDELAEILGVKERDREAFRSALGTYVRSCMKEE